MASVDHDKMNSLYKFGECSTHRYCNIDLTIIFLIMVTKAWNVGQVHKPPCGISRSCQDEEFEQVWWTQTEKKSNAILIKYQCNTNKILKSTALEYFISVALNAILMQYYRAIYRLVLHWYCIETYYVRSILLVLHLSDKLQIVLH